jgi:hypothetical protein
MPSLEGRAKVYARRGLELETPILNKLMTDSENGMTAPFQFHELSSAPLVHRTGLFAIPSAGGSIDALASVTIRGGGHTHSPAREDEENDTQQELIVVETKGRVTANTASKERKRQGVARLRMARGTRERHITDRKYWEVNASSELFKYFVDDSKEAIQILHHAVIYDVKYVLLLMGNNDAEVVGGIFVKFDDHLKKAWIEVLRDVHNLALRWAYKDEAEEAETERMDGPSFEDRTFLDPVLSTIKIQNKKDGKLEFRAFQQWVELWYDVRFRKALPLPPIARVIPYSLAMWNSFKGGSDTLTKLIWNADYNPPTNHIQAHAVARLLLIACTVVHRLNHMATSNDNLDAYRSLRHYRNAANQRVSFFEFMLLLSNMYGNTPEEQLQVEDQVGESTSERMSTRASSTIGESRVGARQTGKTPKRKRIERMDTLMNMNEEHMSGSEKEIVNCFRTCTGPILYLVNKKGNQGPKAPCGLCGKETSWFCFGCHQNFCFTSKINSDVKGTGNVSGEQVPQIVKSSHHVDDDSSSGHKPLFMRNTCWLHAHQKALESTRTTSTNEHNL